MIHCRDKKDQAAIICEGSCLSWSQLEDLSRRLVAGLRQRGLGDGDVLALFLPNGLDFALVAWACEQAGILYAPINKSLTSDELFYILQDSQAKALITHSDFASAALCAQRCPKLTIKLAQGELAGFEDFEAFIQTAPEKPITKSQQGGRIYYTSGTTGRPKGVKRGKGDPEAERIKQKRWPAPYIPGESVNLCPGPLYHAAPLKFDLLIPLSKGVTCVIMPRFDSIGFLALVQEQGITHCHMVATMFQRLLALPHDLRHSYDISSLKQILHGAAPTPIPVKKAMLAWFGPILHEYYGGSEGGGTDITATEWLKKPGSVGKPWHQRRVVICDEAGRALPAGTIGSVYFENLSGETFEYHNAPDKTAKAFRGSLYTLGDIGYVDDDGYLFLTGRSADIIIAGGVNIYPEEIDQVLLEHPAVRDAATIGVPHGEYGEEVKSLIHLEDQSLAGEEMASSLMAFCQERLARFKCPRSIEFKDKLPRSEAGKIMRSQARKPYWERQSAQI